MQRRRSAAFLLSATLITATYAGTGADAAAGSTLARGDQPAVIPGASVPTLSGIAAEDIVGFRYESGWVQIPVQTDERKWFNLRNAYPTPWSGCGGNGNCFSPDGRAFNTQVYADPNTLVGSEIDETLTGVLNGSGPAQTVSNFAGLDGDDEIALMGKDVGGRAPGNLAGSTPAGVVGAGAEVRIDDPIDGGTGYVYLFVRDANATPPLDPSAGVSYVTYEWQVNHIQANHAGDPAATEHRYAAEYRFNGAGTPLGNPETSYVETAHYRREMTGRWHDNVLIIKRGVADPVNILQRHDASITFDYTGTRNQNTFDNGEMAYVTSKGGPIRAIRDYLGTNSGPLVQRAHIFYESSEEISIDLRVHAIPGPQDVLVWNSAATGLRYTDPGGTARIDGIPDAYAGPLSRARNTWSWETIDDDTISPLPTDTAPKGALTGVTYYDSNNSDSSAHPYYLDGAVGGASLQYYTGSLHYQAPWSMASTDVSATGSQPVFLIFNRTLHYEAPLTADGPKRLAQDTKALAFSATVW